MQIDNRIQDIQVVARQRNIFVILSILALFCTFLLSLKIVFSSNKTILVPGLNKEVWIQGDKVSASYLEEMAGMYLPLLLDLDSRSIEWKKNLVLSNTSKTSAKQLKQIDDYFTLAKERYEQFIMSTHFVPKKMEAIPSKLMVRVYGQLISRFGSRAPETEPVIYGLGFQWCNGKLLLNEFVKLKKEEVQ